MSLNCKGCGAPLKVEPEARRVTCGYCGIETLVPQELQHPGALSGPKRDALLPLFNNDEAVFEAWLKNRTARTLQSRMVDGEVRGHLRSAVEDNRRLTEQYERERRQQLAEAEAAARRRRGQVFDTTAIFALLAFVVWFVVSVVTGGG